MSQGLPCKCYEKNKRYWYVEHRKCNYSAFNGYHHTRSDYSRVRCVRCSRAWRTKAYYVDDLPDWNFKADTLYKAFQKHMHGKMRLEDIEKLESRHG
jgi:hypothetical protein